MVLCAHGEFVSAFMFKEQRKPKLSHPELDIHERPYSLKNNEAHYVYIYIYNNYNCESLFRIINIKLFSIRVHQIHQYVFLWVALHPMAPTRVSLKIGSPQKFDGLSSVLPLNGYVYTAFIHIYTVYIYVQTHPRLQHTWLPSGKLT